MAHEHKRVGKHVFIFNILQIIKIKKFNDCHNLYFYIKSIYFK